MTLFPMIQPAAAEHSAAALPLCQDVAWDYASDMPIFCRGEPVIVTGAEAVKVWIWRAIHTPRYAYEIHTGDYGSDLDRLMGQAYTDTLKTAEAPRYLRECLLINPYITAVRNIEVDFAGSVLTIRCIVDTIYGEVGISASV